jgi:hypothetical protein
MMLFVSTNLGQTPAIINGNLFLAVSGFWMLNGAQKKIYPW